VFILDFRTSINTRHHCVSHQGLLSPVVLLYNDLFLTFTECSSLTSELPSIPDSTVCHIKDTCSSVSCCFNVDKIGQSFEASVQIDPCTFLLTITIEKLKFQKNMLEIQWGTPIQMWLFGLLRVE
jgi:hypothetical protein